MENIFIKGNKELPDVKFDASTGNCSLSGRCCPEEATEFFYPLQEWVMEYRAQHMAQPLVLRINLIYFNTASGKHLLELLSLVKQHPDYRVYWLFEDDDEDMAEYGEEFAKFAKIPLTLVNTDTDEERAFDGTAVKS